MFEPGKLKDLVSKPDVHEPFSLGSLIAWLRTKPANKKYCYDRPSDCLLGQYVIEHGGHLIDRSNEYAIDAQTFPVSQLSARGWPSEITYTVTPSPWTFGAALSRALAAQASV